MRLVTIKHHLKALAGGKPAVTEKGASLGNEVISLGLWDNLGDLWSEARMEEVVVYLRGNRHLKLPSWARVLLPTEI